MRIFIALVALGLAGVADAAPQKELLDGYAADAARSTPGFQPSAKRGGEFFARRFGISEKMPNCATCHSNDPTQAGRHVITGKDIKPLAPRGNPVRFTDSAKVEKWFGRNCNEVIGRECTAAEKADLLRFLVDGA